MVPPELASDYARWQTDATGAYDSLPGSLNLRKAYVYWTFNQNNYVSLDRLYVDLLASSENEHDALAESLAARLGGDSDGGSFYDIFSPPEEDYEISFGGDIAMDRLFQMAIYTLETYPGETLLVGPDVGLILPAGS